MPNPADLIKTPRPMDYIKALATTRGGAGNRFGSTYNPAASYAPPPPKVSMWGPHQPLETDNRLLTFLNPRAFSTKADPGAAKSASFLGKGG